VDVKKRKEKRKKRREKKNIVKVNVLFVFFYEYNFYDKIAKIEEEFNILICSRSRIINLYVSCISNIRWKEKILKRL